MELGAAVLGNVAGAKTAQWLGGGDPKQPDIGAQINQLVNGMNDNLKLYLDKAIGSSTDYTNQAIGTQKTGFTDASKNLTDYLNKATQQANMNALYGNMQSQSALSPMLSAGNTALDAYMDSLGLQRPVVGYGALQQANLANAQKQYSLAQLGPAPINPGSSPTAPVKPELSNINPTQQQIQDYINQNSWDAGRAAGGAPGGKYYTGYGGLTNLPNSNMLVNELSKPGYAGNDYTNPSYYLGNGSSPSQQILGAAAIGTQQQLFNQQLANYNQQQAQYQNSMGAYNNNLANYNNYNNQVQQLQSMFGPTPMQQTILNAQAQGLFNK